MEPLVCVYLLLNFRSLSQLVLPSSNHLVEEDSAVGTIRRDACVRLMVGCAEFLKLLYAVFGCPKILIKEKKMLILCLVSKVLRKEMLKKKKKISYLVIL